MKKINTIKIITNEDKAFPKSLFELKNVPKKLYMLGNDKLLKNFSVAIIGARKCETESVKIAEETSYNLAKNKIQIISGMANGIDSVAHRACLKAGGKTIAVLRIGI